MFLYAALFVTLRTFVQVVCDDYASRSSVCGNLLKKAVAETLPDIRSAYFIKVMEADNEAIAQTFTTYHISFLASNTTYASEDEIINEACRMPQATREFLSWTSGMLPLIGVYVCFLLAVRIVACCFKKPIAVVQIDAVAEVEMTEPPKDMPPRSPLYVPQNLEPDKKAGIRRRRGQSRDKSRDRRQSPHRQIVMKPKKTEGPSVMEQMSGISPALKNRIMGDDPMV